MDSLLLVCFILDGAGGVWDGIGPVGLQGDMFFVIDAMAPLSPLHPFSLYLFFFLVLLVSHSVLAPDMLYNF